MAIEKACRRCRYVSTGADKCPACGSDDLTENWAGFVIIIDPQHSEFASIIDAKMAGKYALRIK